jgi:hypothetical protein
MVTRRAKESSSPIRNRRKTMPRSAMPRLGDEGAEAEGAEHGAGAEVAEDGVEAPPAHEGNDDAGGGEHHQGVAVDGEVDGFGHGCPGGTGFAPFDHAERANARNQMACGDAPGAPAPADGRGGHSRSGRVAS